MGLKLIESSQKIDLIFRYTYSFKKLLQMIGATLLIGGFFGVFLWMGWHQVTVNCTKSLGSHLARCEILETSMNGIFPRTRLADPVQRAILTYSESTDTKGRSTTTSRPELETLNGAKVPIFGASSNLERKEKTEIIHSINTYLADSRETTLNFYRNYLNGFGYVGLIGCGFIFLLLVSNFYSIVLPRYFRFDFKKSRFLYRNYYWFGFSHSVPLEEIRRVQKTTYLSMPTMKVELKNGTNILMPALTETTSDEIGNAIATLNAQLPNGGIALDKSDTPETNSNPGWLSKLEQLADEAVKSREVPKQLPIIVTSKSLGYGVSGKLLLFIGAPLLLWQAKSFFSSGSIDFAAILFGLAALGSSLKFLKSFRTDIDSISVKHFESGFFGTRNWEESLTNYEGISFEEHLNNDNDSDPNKEFYTICLKHRNNSIKDVILFSFSSTIQEIRKKQTAYSKLLGLPAINPTQTASLENFQQGDFSNFNLTPPKCLKLKELGDHTTIKSALFLHWLPVVIGIFFAFAGLSFFLFGITRGEWTHKIGFCFFALFPMSVGFTLIFLRWLADETLRINDAQVTLIHRFFWYRKEMQTLSFVEIREILISKRGVQIISNGQTILFGQGCKPIEKTWIQNYLTLKLKTRNRFYTISRAS